MKHHSSGGARGDHMRMCLLGLAVLAPVCGVQAQTTTRHYVYDQHQQLCKVVEAETRATVMAHDGNGNLQWSAAGLELMGTAPGQCDLTSASSSGREVIRAYDSRNRLIGLSFPDRNGDQNHFYWPSGRLKQVTTLNDGVQTYNSYAYNGRGLLVGESLAHADGETWTIAYDYDRNGSLASHRYPSGKTVSYVPNALRQPTQVGSYATGVRYYPDGAIKEFTYGNGIVHSQTQNSRRLPDTRQDAYGSTAFLSDGYDYDHNGNVAGITDGATGRNQRGNRTMAYDGLDRLTSTVSPMFGTATYRYDVLDNLTGVQLTGGTRVRDYFYCYDSNWRLTNVKTGSCSGTTVIGLGYDPQGNLNNKNGQGFLFDFGNRLREASGKELYRYDGHGRRTLAEHSSGVIGSMYDQAGVLRHQKNHRESKSTDYLMLGGRLVAELDSPISQLAPAKDYLTWTAVSGAVRYVVEESVDGSVWTSVYEGAGVGWTSLARASAAYSFRVLACTEAGVCTAVTTVTHAQRPAVDIVPMLYQMLLS